MWLKNFQKATLGISDMWMTEAIHISYQVLGVPMTVSISCITMEKALSMISL